MKDIRSFVFGLNDQNWEQELDNLAKSGLEADFDRILDSIIFEHSREFEASGRVRYCTAFYWRIVDGLFLVASENHDKQSREYARYQLCRDVERFVSGFRRSKGEHTFEGFRNYLAFCGYTERRNDIPARTFTSLDIRNSGENTEELVSRRALISTEPKIGKDMEHHSQDTGIHERFLNFLDEMADRYTDEDHRWLVLLSVCWRLQLTMAERTTGDPLVNYLDFRTRTRLADQMAWKNLRNVDLVEEYWCLHEHYLTGVQRERRVLAEKWGAIVTKRKKEPSQKYLDKLTDRYFKMHNRRLQLKVKTVVKLLRLDEIGIVTNLLSQKFSLSRSFFWEVWSNEILESLWPGLFYKSVMRRRSHGSSRMSI